MDVQNFTEPQEKTEDKRQIPVDELLKLQQEQWITFCAIGGLVTLESDNIDQVQNVRVMPVSEFADKIGVTRQTLYNWKRIIPDFAERVRARRDEVFSLSRETTLFNRAYLIALTSKDHKAAGDMIKMLLGHGARLELPVQRQEIKNEGESWANLVERKQRQVIEAEIINDPELQNHEPQDPNA